MMTVRGTSQVFLWSALAVLAVSAGCGSSKRQVDQVEQTVPLGKTVDSFGSFYQYEAVPVHGYGIVAGLAGSGSGECPPGLREDLISYIRKEIPESAGFNANQFISSDDTAVVEIFGVIPSLASKGENFDVYVRALSETQTTSIAGGKLYTADLKEASAFRPFGTYVKTLAKARGPIFVDKISSDVEGTREGYVLGGGVVSNSVRVAFVLERQNYYVAGAIRNRVNDRFGPDTASAMSPAEVEIRIPQEYLFQKSRFLSMIRMSFLSEGENSERQRIASLVEELVSSDEKAKSEIGLEAIGRMSLDWLLPLLESEDAKTRFHAARCMMHIGDGRATKVLQAFIELKDSPYRIEAINAVGYSAERSEAIQILSDQLDREEFDVRFAAYEHLRRLEGISISRILVGGDFFVETVLGGGSRKIYVSRKDSPRIVLFGGPLRCKDNVFVQMPDGSIIVNCRPEDRYVSVMRKHAGLARPLGPLRCSRDVGDIVRALCGRLSVKDNSQSRPGLGVAYADVISLLEKMCEVGAIDAEFVAGEMTDVSVPAAGQ